MKNTLLSSFAALGIAAAPLSALAEEKSEAETFLFVQHSEAATLADGTLTLKNADKNMIIFADRPHRAAGVVPTSKLLEIWSKGQDSFADDPPNAALVGQSDGKPVSLIIELTNPEKADGNLTFRYTILQGSEVPSIQESYLVIDESPWADIVGGWDLTSDMLTSGSDTIKLDADSGVLGD